MKVTAKKPLKPRYNPAKADAITIAASAIYSINHKLSSPKSKRYQYLHKKNNAMSNFAFNDPAIYRIESFTKRVNHTALRTLIVEKI